MKKYFELIKEVKGIIGLRNVKVAYDDKMDSMHFLLNERQYLQLTNERSKIGAKFLFLLDKYNFNYELSYCDLEVFSYCDIEE